MIRLSHLEFRGREFAAADLNVNTVARFVCVLISRRAGAIRSLSRERNSAFINCKADVNPQRVYSI